MAIPVVANSIYEISINAVMEGQSCVNVYHIQAVDLGGAADPDVDTLETLLGICRLDWRENILPLVTNQYQVQSYIAKRVSGVSAGPRPRIVYDETTDLAGVLVTDAGTGTGDALPTHNTVGIQLKTAVVSRRYRGYKRFAGGRENGTVGNRLTATEKQAWETAAEMFKTDRTSWSSTRFAARPVIFSRTSALAQPGLAPITFTRPVTNIKVRSLIGTQRSRKQLRDGGM